MLTVVFKDKTVVYTSEQTPELFTSDSVLAVISCDVATVEVVVASEPQIEVRTNVTYCTVSSDGTTTYNQDPVIAFASIDRVVVIKFTNSINLYSMTVARNPIQLQRQLEEVLEDYKLHSHLQVGDLVRILEELPPDLKVVVKDDFITSLSFSISGTESLVIRGTRERDKPIRWNDYHESFTS